MMDAREHEEEMDPPSFKKARLKSEQEKIRKQIREKIESLPIKNKL